MRLINPPYSLVKQLFDDENVKDMIFYADNTIDVIFTLKYHIKRIIQWFK